jgi:hypothetical protein
MIGLSLKIVVTCYLYLLLLTCLLSCSLHPKISRTLCSYIIVFVPACEAIPSSPHGFDNLFFIERYYNLTPYACGLSIGYER